MSPSQARSVVVYLRDLLNAKGARPDGDCVDSMALRVSHRVLQNLRDGRMKRVEPEISTLYGVVMGRKSFTEEDFQRYEG